LTGWKFGEKRITGEVLLVLAKAFDAVWVFGLLCKLTVPNFPSYLVRTISYYLHDGMFEVSYQTATSTVVASKLAWHRVN
jgi:hypothetical protein